MNAEEALRRRGNNIKLRTFLEARPMEWIDAKEFEDVAGRQGWRTRISEVRQQLERADAGTIENRLTFRHRCMVQSEYRFLPHRPIGRDSTQPTPALPLFDDGPWAHR